MALQLTTGALSKMCQGEVVTDPLLQILEDDPISRCVVT